MVRTLLMASTLIFVLAVTSFASAASTFAPNRYECKVGNGKVVYTTTSIAGVPTYFYDDGTDKKPFSASGNAILVSPSQLGGIVSVQVGYIPDLSQTVLNLIVPEINLTQQKPTATFTTRLVRTVSLTSIAGPQNVEGVLLSNEFLTADCTAAKVIF